MCMWRSSPEQFSYDADGNLTNDGRWAYAWDGENRLVQMTVNTNVGPQYQLTFGYDSQGPADPEDCCDEQRHGLRRAVHEQLPLRRLESGRASSILNLPFSQSFMWGRI